MDQLEKDDRSLPAPVIERYARQLLVPSMGAAAHAKLAAGSVLVVGAGGLGCGCLPYLAGTAGSDSVSLVALSVLAQEVERVRVVVLHGLRHVDDVDGAAEPKQVVL